MRTGRKPVSTSQQAERPGTHCSSCDHPAATEHGSTRHRPAAPFPFSAPWEGEHQKNRFVNSQGIHWAVFRNGDNVKRSRRGLQIKTMPHFITHGYTSVVRTGRHGSGSVTKPPTPILTQGSSAADSPWPNSPETTHFL